jgi:serine kinase of HPr protein (carbohydrate metabolism regulator)
LKTLVHATAVVVGTTGIVIVGPSGSGKSSIALRLMDEARRCGHFAALIGDDQIFVEPVNGRVIATAPETISGLIEIRGSGIGKVATIGSGVLNFALQPVVADSANRIPEENQDWSPVGNLTLPLHHIDRAAVDPFSRLVALISGFPVPNLVQD